MREIKKYISSDSPEVSERVVLRIVHATRRLKVFPKSGAVAPEITKRLIREILVYHYRILYQTLENDTTVRIVGIIHGARLLTDDMLED